jgi:thiol-disulfide isomerase/thioredoxin
MPAASGKARIINVWALWCAPCRHELPSLQRLATTLDTVEVWAVALAEDCFAVREYLAQHAPGLRGLVLAPGAPQVRELGLATLPQTFAVSGEGALRARWTGAREWDSPAQRSQIALLLQAA